MLTWPLAQGSEKCFPSIANINFCQLPTVYCFLLMFVRQQVCQDDRQATFEHCYSHGDFAV